MARIRTIKPEFFTSEDVVALTSFARLLYIALWCEADREGRMKWQPKTFKMRYFPADKLDSVALCSELVSFGLVILYGDGLAYIPSFKKHQHINPRESVSTLPEPDLTRESTVTDASARVSTRETCVVTRESTVTDAQVGREGKGKEEAEPFILPDWIPADAWKGYVDMRKKIKKPMTDRACELKVVELRKFREAGHDLAAILNKSAANSWTDIYEPKHEAKGSASNGLRPINERPFI